MGSDARIAVLVKVVPTGYDVDPLTGTVSFAHARPDVSAADRAALAVAMTLAEPGDEVVIYNVGTVAADPVLRQLVASGATRAHRCALDGDDDVPMSQWLNRYPSATVAHALATVVEGARFVVAGDHSLDRGSGTVPSRVAERLGVDQALGLVAVDGARRRALRRLSNGWREEIDLCDGMVVSVEASAGRLGRGSPNDLRTAPLIVTSVADSVRHRDGDFAPYRPASSVVAAPANEVAARRAMEVIGALAAPRQRVVHRVDPVAGAHVIWDCLKEWGYRA